MLSASLASAISRKLSVALEPKISLPSQFQRRGKIEIAGFVTGRRGVGDVRGEHGHPLPAQSQRRGMNTEKTVNRRHGRFLSNAPSGAFEESIAIDVPVLRLYQYFS